MPAGEPRHLGGRGAGGDHVGDVEAAVAGDDRGRRHAAEGVPDDEHRLVRADAGVVQRLEDALLVGVGLPGHRVEVGLQVADVAVLVPRRVEVVGARQVDDVAYGPSGPGIVWISMVPLAGESGWPEQVGHLVQVCDQVAHRRGLGWCPARWRYGVTTGRPGSPYSMPRASAGRDRAAEPGRPVLGQAGWSVSASGPVAIAAAASGPTARELAVEAVDRGRTDSSVSSRNATAERTATASTSQPSDAPITPSGPPVTRARRPRRPRSCPGHSSPDSSRSGSRITRSPSAPMPRSRSPAPSNDLRERAGGGVRRGDAGRPAGHVDDLGVLVDGHDSPGRSTSSQSRWPDGGGTNRSSSSSTGSGSTLAPARRAGPARPRPAPSPCARSRRSGP